MTRREREGPITLNHVFPFLYVFILSPPHMFPNFGLLSLSLFCFLSFPQPLSFYFLFLSHLFFTFCFSSYTNFLSFAFHKIFTTHFFHVFYFHRSFFSLFLFFFSSHTLLFLLFSISSIYFSRKNMKENIIS